MSRQDHRSVASEAQSESAPRPRPGLAGRVFLPDGTPAAGALVALSTEEGNSDLAAKADETGLFHLPSKVEGPGEVIATLGSLKASISIGPQDEPVVLHLKESQP